MLIVFYCLGYFITRCEKVRMVGELQTPDCLHGCIVIYHTLSYFANGCGALPPDLDRLYCRVCCLQMSRNKASEQAAVILAPSFTDVLGYIYLIKYKYKYQTKIQYIYGGAGKRLLWQAAGAHSSHPCA